MKDSVVMDLKDISDSIEIFREKPRKIMPVFSYCLIGLLIAAFFFAYFGKIDEYVKSRGIVRPADTISEVIIPFSGNVADSNIFTGKEVKKGDILLRADDTLYVTAINTLTSQKNKLERDLINFEKLRKSVEENNNLFDKTLPDEQEYYYIFQQYYLKLQTNKEQYGNTNNDLAKAKNELILSANNALNRIKDLNADLSQCRLFKESAEKKTSLLDNQLPNYELYKLRLNDYLLITTQYQSAYNDANKAAVNAAKMYEIGGVSKIDFESAKSKRDEALYQLNKYANDFLTEIQQTIEKIVKDIDDCEKNSGDSNSMLQYYSENGIDINLALDSTQVESIVSINEQIRTLKNQLESIDKEISDANFNLSNTVVKSPIDGTIDVYTEINIGDFVNGGTKLARIIPTNSGDIKITLYIASSDINEIFEGQKVQLRFSALPYKDHGEFSAVISYIPEDSRIDTNAGGENYYFAETTLNLNDISEDKVVLIKSGMECEAKVITKQRNILTWVLHKINFLEV